MSWDDLAVAALLGTDRRRLDLAGLPGVAGRATAHLDAGDAAAALLDSAAVLSAYRRSGQQATAGAVLPSPAPTETSPTVSAAAAARLTALLDADELTFTRNRDLVIEWLTVAEAAGRVAPPAALPALLDLAVGDRDIAAAVPPVLGRRGAWLAAFAPQWRTTMTATDVDLADDEAWRLGDAATRRAWFAALRRADPARARDLLAASWKRETGPHREAFLDELHTGLAAADEPLLEQALDDRRAGVRERAAALLRQLPTSALAGRMQARVAQTVVVHRGLLRARLSVRPPQRCDDALQRDGVTATSRRPGRADPAWWVEQIVAATPLGHWTAALRTGPEGVLRTPVEEGWREVLVDGWAAAAVRERESRWAAVLLPHVALAPARQLYRVLPAADQSRAILATFRSPRGFNDERWLNAMLIDLPDRIWPDPVAEVVLGWLATGGTPPPTDQTGWLRLTLAGRRLPVDLAGRVAAAATRHASDSPWRAAVSGVAEQLAYRRAMHEELR